MQALTQLADIFANAIYPKIIPQNIASTPINNRTNPLEIPSVPPTNTKKTRVQNNNQTQPTSIPTMQYNLRPRVAHSLVKIFYIENANQTMDKVFAHTQQFTSPPVNNLYN